MCHVVVVVDWQGRTCVHGWESSWSWLLLLQPLLLFQKLEHLGVALWTRHIRVVGSA